SRAPPRPRCPRPSRRSRDRAPPPRGSPRSSPAKQSARQRPARQPPPSSERPHESFLGVRERASSRERGSRIDLGADRRLKPGEGLVLHAVVAQAALRLRQGIARQPRRELVLVPVLDLVALEVSAEA